MCRAVSLVRRRKDRDLERLKLLEELGSTDVARPSAPAAQGRAGQIARYARFRHVGTFILLLAMGAAAVGAAGIVIACCELFRTDADVAGGILRALAWIIATLTSYGVLKCAGEVLFLLADSAELANSLNERAADVRTDGPR